MTNKPRSPGPRPQSLPSRWYWKFANAIRGLAAGIRGQNSFYVHLPAAVLACGLAAWLQVSHAEWLALVLCITLVLTAELFNSSLEHLARAVSRQEHPEIRDALDIASGAVLVASAGASVVGVMVLVYHLFGDVTP
jgi:diacylglycerol kinase